MRTKTLLVTALLSLAGVSAALAQASTNVYSVNVVGYVQVTVTNYGTVQRLLATPLGPVGNTNNWVSVLVPAPSEGTQISKLGQFGYESVAFGFGAWDNDLELPVGTGFFIKLGWTEGDPPPAPVIITFVGDVQQRADSNMTFPAPVLPATESVSLVGSLVPVEGSIITVHNIPGGEGNQVSRIDPFGGWESIAYGFGAWDNDLVIGVAEGFYYRNVAPNGALPWVRDFVVQ